ncbi:endonuclease [Kitasatospora sp. MMS16-BH015]|uniref:endonuclease n=1 Tax=Kitasatospora sp. MMS16-BH015 TaxID=2018025 RepID=UPI000CA363E8|nr:endonuclease [Kitasatospora sp. MMS16-BH015]AUG80489.1 endonuclease [Kitasatospora sp. MMS16-BH015]
MTVETVTARLLAEHGRTYAEQAGITLRDKPAPLYRLLVLTVLCSVPIDADLATAAARELFRAGYRTPRAMARSGWQARVDALGRAHYVRYDEGTATALGEGAELVLDRWHGDLRRLREAAGESSARLGELLQEVPRIGPVGAAIFCREAQAVWPQLRPYFDDRACAAAERLGLPHTPRGLGRLVPPEDHARLAAALVRVSLAPEQVAALRAG